MAGRTGNDGAIRSLSFSKPPPRVRAVSKPDPESLNALMANFALGPSWAKATSPPSKPTGKKEFRDAGPPKDSRGGGDRRERFDRDDRGGGPFNRGRKGGFDRPPREPRDEPPPPATGVNVTLVPEPQAVQLVAKEIHQVARVYPIIDVAKILLAERGRCIAVFEASPDRPPMFRGRLDTSLFLTRAEAMDHLWRSDLKPQLLDEETTESDPPSGNFQVVARCGLSGEWLGPPNFHAYQSNLRRIHQERYPHLPFAVYTSKVRTERGEEAVNAWLESMKQRTRWRIKGGSDDDWSDDPMAVKRLLEQRCFDQAFEETHQASFAASIPPSHLSPSLMTSMRMAGNHARNHPSVLIPAICKALEKEHLPIFKRQGKLFTGPARPNPLPKDATLAERPAVMVGWIRANAPAKLEGLWKAVLPEGGTAPPAEFAADLFWLLQQGHILLFTDDTLVVQEVRETAPQPQAGVAASSTQGNKKRRKKSGVGATGDGPVPEATTETDVRIESEVATEPEATSEPAPSPGEPAPAIVTDEPVSAVDEAAADVPPTGETATEEHGPAQESGEVPGQPVEKDGEVAQEAEPNTSTSM